MASDDVSAIQELIYRERKGRDHGHWDDMRSAYSANAKVNVSWYQGDANGFIEASIRVASQGISAKHRLGHIEIHLNGPRAFATISASIESREIVDDCEADLNSQVTLLYRLMKNLQRQWKISYLTCIYEHDSLVPVHAAPLLLLAPCGLSQYRTSYRYLSYILEQKGISIDQHLPGQDRPKEVEKLLDGFRRWILDTEEEPEEDKRLV